MDREQLIRRFVAVSHELAAMAAHKLLPNLASDREGELLEELDAIEFNLAAAMPATSCSHGRRKSARNVLASSLPAWSNLLRQGTANQSGASS